MYTRTRVQSTNEETPNEDNSVGVDFYYVQKTQKTDFRDENRFHDIITKGTKLFSVRFLKGSDASCANVTVRFFTVFYVGNLLYVYLESSSRFTVRVAYVVTRRLTFTANIAYSGHIKHLRFWVIFF